MRMINIGIIGCGHWGPNHIRVFSQLPGSRVVAGADLDPKRLDAVRKLYPYVETYKDHHQMLRKKKLDAIVVATPTKWHYEMVRDALNAGKHVLCEKPLCLQSSQGEELVALAESKSLILMVGHVFLFNPGIIKLHDLVRSRQAGRVYYLRALRTNLGPVREDVNSVFDLATHDISIFNSLLNALPKSVSATGAAFLQPGIEDVAFITLRYPNHVFASIHVSWLDPKKLRELIVVGDKRMIVWDEFSSPGPIIIYDKGMAREPYYDDYGQFQLLAREGDITIPRVTPVEPLKVQNRYFLQCVKENKIKMNDGRFAIGVLKVIEAVTKSMKADGAAVAIAK